MNKLKIKDIDGNLISKILYQELNNYLLKKDKVPIIVDISIGKNLNNEIYTRTKQKKLEKYTNIKFKSIHFDKITYLDLKKYIKDLNSNKEITGIVIQLPLPDYLKKYERNILDAIDKKKDIDGLTSLSAGLLSTTNDTLIPATVLGIETILKVYDVLLEGKKVAIINRSNLIGKPLTQLMLRNNATPIICHSKTSNLEEITKFCDIIIIALNKQEYITSNYIKEGAIIIDIGVHKNKLGQIVGDVDYKDVYNKASLITPPTGSIGPMTICMLAYNAAKSIYGEEVNKILNQGIVKAKNKIGE